MGITDLLQLCLYAIYVCMHACMLNVQLLAIPWTVACQAPLSTGFSIQEYWSGLLFPSPGESFWPRDRTWVSCIPGRHINLWATREVLGSPLKIKGKEEIEKVGLKLNIQKTKVMASSPITSWQMEKNGNSSRFYSPVLQNHCGWWLQPWN